MQKSVTTVICSLIIMIFSFLLYSKTRDYGFILDDRIAITENTVTMAGAESYSKVFKVSFYHGANNKNKNVYRPLTSLTFAWNVARQDLGPREPLDPAPFRSFNLQLHSLCCLLVFLLLYQEVFRDKLALSMIITLIFVAHPIHTEVVANIKSRDELFGLFGAVGSLYFLLKGVRLNNIWYLISGYLVFAIGVFSKESIITFVALIPIAWYFFTELSIKKTLLLSVPLLLTALFYLVIRGQVLESGIFMEQSLIQNALVEADGFLGRLPTNFVMLGKYLSLLTVPTPLSADYSYNQIPIVGWGNFWALLSMAFHAFLLYIVVVRFTKKDPLVYAILFYYISLFVVSNIIILIGAQFAERFVFLPSLGYCIVFALLLERGINTLFKGIANKVFIAISAIVVIVFSIMTNNRNDDWENVEKLHKATLAAAPNSARAQYNYAAVFFNKANKESNPNKKIELYKTAQNYYSRAVEICPNYGTAWYYLGDAYFNNQDTAKAWNCYKKFIYYEGPNARTYNTMGVIKGMNGQLDSSQYYLSECVKLEPDYGEACANLGKTYIQKAIRDSTEKRLDLFLNAKKYLEQAITAKVPPPSIPEIERNLKYVENELLKIQD